MFGLTESTVHSVGTAGRTMRQSAREIEKKRGQSPHTRRFTARQLPQLLEILGILYLIVPGAEAKHSSICKSLAPILMAPGLKIGSD